MNSRWYAESRSAFWYIIQYNCVGPNARVVPNAKRAEDLCSSSYVHVATDPWHTAAVAHANGYLLEEEAIHANLRIGMNNDAIRVRHGEAPTDLAVDWDVCARDHAPEAVAQHGQPADQGAHWIA